MVVVQGATFMSVRREQLNAHFGHACVHAPFHVGNLAALRWVFSNQQLKWNSAEDFLICGSSTPHPKRPMARAVQPKCRQPVLALTSTSLHIKPYVPPPIQVGFPQRDPKLLAVALDNTYRLVWVRSTKQSRVARMGQLLGFARATRWEQWQEREQQQESISKASAAEGSCSKIQAAGASAACQQHTATQGQLIAAARTAVTSANSAAQHSRRRNSASSSSKQKRQSAEAGATASSNRKDIYRHRYTVILPLTWPHPDVILTASSLKLEGLATAPPTFSLRALIITHYLLPFRPNTLDHLPCHTMDNLTARSPPHE